MTDFRNILSFLSVFLFLFSSLMLSGQTGEQLIYQKVRVHLEGKGLNFLATLGVEVEHGYRRKEDVMINFYTTEEVESIRQAGFKVDILQEDAIAHYQAESRKVRPVDLALATRNAKCLPDSRSYDVPGNFKYGSMGSYLTYSELLAELDLMRAKYPHLITPRRKMEAFQTKNKNYIEYVKISDFPEEEEGLYENQILFTALHHAREPMSMMQMIYFMWYILEKYNTDPEIRYLLNKTELFFIPCVNPDGYKYNQQTNPTGGGLWRKNRNNIEVTAGVDINRNYGLGWGYDDEGSSPIQTSETYRGKLVFSELETRAVRSLFMNNNFKMVVNYHSFANVMIYPWGYLEKNTYDSLTYTYFAQDLTQYSDYRYGLNNETLGYPINGTADDWMYNYDHGDPDNTRTFAFTFECGGAELTDEESFWPLPDKIQPICASMLYQNIRALWLVNEGLTFQSVSDHIVRPGNNTARIMVTRVGLKNGPVTVSVRPVTPNVVNFNKDFTLDPDHLEAVQLDIPYQITGNANGIVRFEVNTFYDGYLKKDTVAYKVLKYQKRFENNGDDLSVFVKQNFGENWELDQSDYYDTFASFALNNLSSYDKAENKSLELKNPVYIPESDSLAFLSFYAKWYIEKNIDYLKVYVSEDGFFWEPMCGNYSQIGNIDQGEEDPVLDGFQPDWVNVVYDISTYRGKNVYFKLVFRSDAKVNKKGINVDKLELLGVPRSNLSTGTGGPAAAISIGPNPASDEMIVYRENAEQAVIKVFDVQGRPVKNEKLGNKTERLDVSTLVSGVYIYQIFNFDNELKASGKIIIAKNNG